MCGIAGVYRLRDGGPAPTEALLRAMTGAFAYRGPDDEGYALHPAAGLGVRRLAIVDPERGHQPMASPDGGIASACNGEIYNHAELRQDLEREGHAFATHCDVEVLIPLYRHCGDGFVPRLNGQFALAVYDAARHRLVLARDRMGIAPLFYTVADGSLLFASEIKGLLCCPAVRRDVDLRGLDQILTFPGLASPQTMFRDVCSLPPGHLLVAHNGAIEVRAYWDLDFPPAGEPAGEPDEDAAREVLADRLRRAVGRRLQGDVPIGFYLSGGLDSSLIGSLIHELSPAPRHSFSIRFPDPAMDEGRFQRLMAQRLGGIHHEVAFSPDDVPLRLAAMVRHAETPLKESYNACSLMLSAAVRAAGVKAILTGEGADELMGGYVGYRLDEVRGGPARRPGAAELLEAELQAELWGDPSFFYEKRYVAHRDARRALYSDSVNSRFDEVDCTARPLFDTARLARWHPFHRRSYLDCKLRMADHLLADHGDRVAYAHSVEARYPFLDQDVVEFVAGLPPGLLLRDGREKHLLRRVAESRLPDDIVNRQKFAFVAPASPDLLRRRIPWIEDLLDPARIRRHGYFNPATVARLAERYRQPGFSLNTTFEDDWLMIVLSFGILLQEFRLPDRT